MISDVCAYSSLTLLGRHVINARFALLRSERVLDTSAHERRLRGGQI
jgi:hypothetical protein